VKPGGTWSVAALTLAADPMVHVKVWPAIMATLLGPKLD
jgi:hypothetical protein